MTAPFFVSNTAIVAYFFGKEVWDFDAGIVAAALMAICPGYISRSVVGSYDNEGVAIFALLLTFYLFVKAVNTGSLSWSLASAFGLLGFNMFNLENNMFWECFLAPDALYIFPVITALPFLFLVMQGCCRLGSVSAPACTLERSDRGFAFDIGRNVIHGSDAVESANKEIALWFPKGVANWQSNLHSWIYE
ncbi:hypothetical protein KIW84_063001 [Lathyrus oleraceus]|uniref:dolichyl-diphosphooligosaccharide--protein glycotransferase n=1 Tax=Pisum sativum TaxID=3888 RepID=A0A9D4W8H8_PEA|nr:hypothetical protein KIW84_063001 [Pisum sativum]